MGCGSSAPAQMPPPGGFEHHAPAPYPAQTPPPTNTQQTATAQDDASIDFSTLNIKQLQVCCDQINPDPSDRSLDRNLSL